MGQDQAGWKEESEFSNENAMGMVRKAMGMVTLPDRQVMHVKMRRLDLISWTIKHFIPVMLHTFC